MRKLGPTLGIAIVLFATQASLAQPAPPPPGNQPHTRPYSGSTSQAQPISIEIVKGGDRWRLGEADFAFRMRCQDGTKYRLGLGIGWFGDGPPLDDHGRFSVDQASPFDVFRFHGRLGPKGGSGTVEYTEPALTQDEQPIKCTSKERTWTVKREPGGPPPPPGPGPSPTPAPAGSSSHRTMYMRVEANGKAHVSRSWN